MVALVVLVTISDAPRRVHAAAPTACSGTITMAERGTLGGGKCYDGEIAASCAVVAQPVLILPEGDPGENIYFFGYIDQPGFIHVRACAIGESAWLYATTYWFLVTTGQ